MGRKAQGRRVAAAAALLGLLAWLSTAGLGIAAPAPGAPPAPALALLAAAHFAEPLVATGPTAPAEDAALARAVAAYEGRGSPDDFVSLTEFLSAYPHSAWRAAVLTNLGIDYLHYGYFSRALAAWEAAWRDGKSATDYRAKRLVDRAVGELVELNAELGHQQRLTELLNEIGDRPATGPATEMVQNGQRMLWVMRTDPKHLYLCGPTALKMLMRSQSATLQQVAFLNKVRAGPKGTSLAEIATLAAKAGVGLVPVFREPGEKVPLPSVVHWKVGHFAAVVGERNGRFEVKDPTFGEQSLWVTRAAIDAEASGYFLALADAAKTAGWRQVGASEADQVWGAGPTKKKRKGHRGPPAKHPKNPCPLCSYDISELAVGVLLNDEPVGYVPPKGPSAKISIIYDQRQDSQPANFKYFNISPKWTFNWLSYIQDDPTSPGANVMRFMPDGEATFYTDFNTATRSFARTEDDASILVLEKASPTVYKRFLTNGSVEVYAESDGGRVFPRNIFLTQVIDPQGNAVTLSYGRASGRVRLVSLTDATGRRTTFAYGLPGAPLLITRITDPFGRSAELGYDGKGRLSSITDILGLTSRFVYDASSQVKALTTPYGTTRFAYGADGMRRFVNVTDPMGFGEREEAFEPAPVPSSEPLSDVPTGIVAPFNQFLNYRNSFHWDQHQYAVGGCTPNGGCNYRDARITHFNHDLVNIDTEWSSIESIKEPLENRVWYNYPGQPASGIGAGASGSYDQPTAIGRVLDNGQTQLKRFAYNAAGNPTIVVDPIGRQTLLTYAANKTDVVRIRQAAAGGNVAIAELAYNSKHRPLSYTDTAGRITRYTYNAAGQLTSETNPLGQKTSYAYDSLGYLTTIVNANGKIAASFGYDRFGRVASLTDSEGWTVAYAYDAADRPTRATYPDGSTEEYTYDRLDVATIKDRQNRVSKYAHDADRRLTAVIDPLGHKTAYAYFENGTLKSLTDADGHRTSWDVDVESRPIAKHYADGSVTRYGFEHTASRLKSVTDALGQSKNFNYALDNRLAGIRYDNALNPTPRVGFVYDPDFPRVVAMTDGTGTTKYSYVPAGSVGALGLEQETGPLPDGAISYSYDALGRVIGRAVGGAPAESFQYDKIGRLIRHADALGGFALAYLGQSTQLARRTPAAAGIVTTWSYLGNSGDRRLADISNGSLRQYRYTTTANDLITGIKESKGGSPLQSWSFGYDKDNRLLAANSTSGKKFGYTLDPAGNLTKISQPSGTTTQTYNRVNALTAVGAQPVVSDADGNTVSDGARNYAWDAENRLVGITYKAQPGKRTSFAYDGLARRVAVRTTLAGKTTVTDYVWCGLKICQSRNRPGTVNRLYYDEGEAIPASGARLFYGPDQLGSIRDVLAKSPVFSFVQAYNYDPYGSPTKPLPPGPLTDFRYAGMLYHADSGLYLTQFRAYDPRTGRWLGRDPLEEAAGANLFAYANGSPLSVLDPFGLKSVGAGFGGVDVGPVNIGPGGVGIGPISVGPGGVTVDPIPNPAAPLGPPYSDLIPQAERATEIAALQNAYQQLLNQLQKMHHDPNCNKADYQKLRQAADRLAKTINALIQDYNNVDKSSLGGNHQIENQYLSGHPPGWPGGPPVPGGYGTPMAAW